PSEESLCAQVFRIEIYRLGCGGKPQYLLVHRLLHSDHSWFHSTKSRSQALESQDSATLRRIRTDKQLQKQRKTYSTLGGKHSERYTVTTEAAAIERIKQETARYKSKKLTKADGENRKPAEINTGDGITEEEEIPRKDLSIPLN
ncbi:hypothetical protein A2U01_0035626, partial [Trifolium medium]|nr:hypothetical protein [Trifolium medium]